MRICFVTPYGYPILAGDRRAQVVGGAEVQQVLISTELARRGHEVSMISLDFGQPEGIRVRGVTCLKSCKEDELNGGLRFFHPRITSLWSAMRRADADIYYQRSSGLGTGVVAAFARRHGRRMVFASAAATDFEAGLPRLKLMRDKWIYRYGVSRAHRIVVQSELQQSNCLASFGRSAVCISSCYGHRGVDAQHDGVILWVGNTRPHKRPELFVELAARLPQYRFRLVGGSSYDDASVAQLKSMAAGLQNLELTGFVPYADIEPQFDGASLIVNTSPAEGFPNTYLQAWSRRMPSVGFFDIGARLEDQQVGCQVPDLDSMVTMVVRLKSDVELWRREGQRAASYVARNNSPAKVVDRYEMVFSELLPAAEVVSA
jgi:glycosyltransferase involved in cell wall biosynthesis